MPNFEYPQFVSAAMQFLASRPGARAIIVVETPDSTQSFSSEPSFAWQRGILENALQFLMIRMMDQQGTPEQRAEQNRRFESELQGKIKDNRGKAN